ncbi:MAG: YkgJ family cysteine cluster protein [Planctomycetes bacterium]|nr:YkgJ family cysteine cluster protein [Planctomycetota bacterium]
MDLRCAACPRSKCCRQISVEIDKPVDADDFEDLLWFVAHRGVSLFVDEGDWYVSMETPCTHLQQDGLCGIYEDRPKICRDYSSDGCDRDEDTEYDLSFQTHEELLAYVRVRFPDFRATQHDVFPREPRSMRISRRSKGKGRR